MKIFRQLRQQFLVENKNSKYLKYAIGEIVLVVIGILIALQVNNWNEGRKENEVQLKYLKNLKHDLLNDITDLNRFKKIRLGKVESARQLLQLAKQEQIDDVYTIDSLYFDVGLWYEFVPNNNSFKELISSGNLNIIKNDSIKDLLLQLSKKNELIVADRNHMRREYDIYLYDKRNKEISFLEVNDPSEITEIDDWFYPNYKSVAANHSKLKEKYAQLLKDATFINGLALSAGNNQYMVQSYDDMISDINKLMSLIDKEFKEPR